MSYFGKVVLTNRDASGAPISITIPNRIARKALFAFSNRGTYGLFNLRMKPSNVSEALQIGRNVAYHIETRAQVSGFTFVEASSACEKVRFLRGARVIAAALFAAAFGIILEGFNVSLALQGKSHLVLSEISKFNGAALGNICKFTREFIHSTANVSALAAIAAISICTFYFIARDMKNSLADLGEALYCALCSKEEPTRPPANSGT